MPARCDDEEMTLRAVQLSTVAVVALGGAALLAWSLGGRSDESWYGIPLGEPIESMAGVRFSPATRMYPASAVVEHPPAPWTEVHLSVSDRGHEVVGIQLFDPGVEMIACAATPCPPPPRVKPVAQTRAEGAQVRAGLVARMGEPTTGYVNGGESLLIWDFDRPGLTCVQGQLRPRILGGDAGHRVRLVTLRLSDDMVFLEVRGRAAFESAPGAIPVPTAPPPPGPPPPPCP